MNRTIEASYGLSDLSSKTLPIALGREWRIGLAVAVLTHIGLLYGFQAALRHPAALPADTALEITMVAAPAESVAEGAPGETAAAIAPTIEPAVALEPKPVEPVAEPVPDSSAEPKPSEEPLPAPTEPEPPQPVAIPNPIEVSAKASPSPTLPVQQIALAEPASTGTTSPSVGDGSSAKPGLDATSVRAAAGVRAKPNYLRNPEPPYPAVARRRRQQGTVLLAVKVSAEGWATRVELKQTSGYPVLDAAALEAVPGWEFEPARLGSVKVDSEIEVPVRFQLSK